MRTYSCLIVDDEPLLLRRLEKMFAGWAASGAAFRLAGAATSANEAEQMALRLSPDIVITDIVMPGRSGIDLIAALKPKLPHTAFLLLSAYSDFAYAKQAISMDVLEYLVKVPLSERDLYAALCKARDKAEAHERDRSELARLGRERREHVYRLRRTVLEEIAAGATPPETLVGMRDALLLGEPLAAAGTYGCVLLKLDSFAAFQRSWAIADQKLYRFAILNIMEEIVKDEHLGGFCCELGASRFAAVLFRPQAGVDRLLADTASHMARTMADSIRSYLKLPATAAPGDTFRQLRQLPEALRETGARLDGAFYADGGCVVASSFRPGYGAAAEAQALLAALERALDGGFAEEAEAALARLRAALAADPPEPAALLAAGKEWAERMRRKLPPGVWAAFEFAAAASPDDRDCGEWLAALAAACRAALAAERGGGRERDEIRKSRRYIEDRLTERLYLEQVAEHVCMNPTYFSELFKREVGEGFSEYVGRRRIDKAAELLRSREYSNTELAEAVGIQSEKYFCTLFKKYKGVTPQKYVRCES
ncbi:MAG: AraC family transcriptional regulator [Paenibacillaceae bacterium]|nr:AraC family transcriptional regulator [Paenibacillaceae bacterium]